MSRRPSPREAKPEHTGAIFSARGALGITHQAVGFQTLFSLSWCFSKGTLDAVSGHRGPSPEQRGSRGPAVKLWGVRAGESERRGKGPTGEALGK